MVAGGKGKPAARSTLESLAPERASLLRVHIEPSRAANVNVTPQASFPVAAYLMSAVSYRKKIPKKKHGNRLTPADTTTTAHVFCPLLPPPTSSSAPSARA